jgi:hypothetical protein
MCNYYWSQGSHVGLTPPIIKVGKYDDTIMFATWMQQIDNKWLIIKNKVTNKTY